MSKWVSQKPKRELPEAVNGGGGNSQSNNKNNNAAGANNINGLQVETPSSNNVSSSPGQCDQTLWDDVYNPARLQIVDRCKIVTGTIGASELKATVTFIFD